MSAWIKCSERMPTDEEAVLIYSVHFGVVVAWHTKSGWLVHGGGRCSDAGTPHWQPLPEPPERASRRGEAMTPDARVQEAVERAKAWLVRDETEDERLAVRLAIDADSDTWNRGAIMGYACGLLASTPETERLREALTRVLMWPPRSTEAACEQDYAFARSLLTPTRDPR